MVKKRIYVHEAAYKPLIIVMQRQLGKSLHTVWLSLLAENSYTIT